MFFGLFWFQRLFKLILVNINKIKKNNKIKTEKNAMYFSYIIETMIVALWIKCLTRDAMFGRLFKRVRLAQTHSMAAAK